ncbi:MAG: DNA phosphorothioation-dependent restriction protein DptH [Peptostreptococcaceae bacterium]|jgi:DNA phosphorothioation-dependent restriction protein DptH|nr:DNA phosphorothioation-dependent restriction protein DptH [Peptostreptococcaceae bacterium]
MLEGYCDLKEKKYIEKNYSQDDLFYDYIAKTVIEYLSEISISDGERFSIQFETQNQVDNLYRVLKFKDSEDVEINNYKTYILKINDKELLVSKTDTDISSDYLTYLRNNIGKEGTQFESKSILFIHNTDLDSIVNGSKRLEAQGMPLYYKTIMDSLNKDVKESKMKNFEKKVMKFAVNNRGEDIYESNTSAFDYKDFLISLNKEELEIIDYNRFNLFYDSNLESIDKSDSNTINASLAENNRLFGIVYGAHKYHDLDTTLPKYFDEDGVRELKKDNWYEKDFDDIKKYYQNRNKEKENNLKDIKLINESEQLVYWNRAKSEETKTGRRERNIIIFNPLKLETINLDFYFEDYVSNSSDRLKINKSDLKYVECKTRGKRINAKITHHKNQSSYYEIKYEKVKLKIMIVEFKEDFLINYKTAYRLQKKSTSKGIVKNQGIVIFNDDNDSVIFGDKYSSNITEIDYKKDRYSIQEEDSIKIKNLKEYSDVEECLIKFNINDSDIDFVIDSNYNRPIVINGDKVFKIKNEKKCNFDYDVDTQKLIIQNANYFTREEFRANLRLENMIIENQIIYASLSNSQDLKKEELEIDYELESAYKKILEYYKEHLIIPSLTYLNDELENLYSEFLEIYLMKLNEIEEVRLGRLEENLLKIGIIKELDSNQRILFTPLSPINMAYQIILKNNINEEDLPIEVIRKLKPNNLIPFIYSDGNSKKIYNPIDQNHSQEWIYYVDKENNKYNSSKDFVSNLVRDKIMDFKKHFDYLFISPKTPFKINLINLGECKEVLQGIFKYYQRQLNNKVSVEKLTNIEINIYSDMEEYNVFEEISFYEDVNLIKEHFDLDLKLKNYEESDLIDIYREKVHFNKRKIDNEFEYSHISFYKIQDQGKQGSLDLEKIQTGVSISGLISGVNSIYDKNEYVTGFGTKNMNIDNILLELSVKLNNIHKYAYSGEQLTKDRGIITTITDDENKKIDRLYDKSHWITFIDPKVDLNFFKNNPNSKDLLIIHYSDQYTTTTGYDAITVTRKSNQYKILLDEYLKNKCTIDNIINSDEIINLFNSTNGEWLLNLISRDNKKKEKNRDYFSKEKLSIISALKMSLAFLDNENIYWIPVSLEEVVRISGGIGLKLNESLLSAKKLDSKNELCDDLLMVGIDTSLDKLKVYLYPIEVKIGFNKTNVKEKGKNQIHNLIEFLNQNLVDKMRISLKKKVYRNFIIQLALVSLKKLIIYDIWSEKKYQEFLESEYIKDLLSDDYKLMIYNNETEYDYIFSSIKKGALISFKKEETIKDIYEEDEILCIKLLEGDMFKYLGEDINKIKEFYNKDKFDEFLISKKFIDKENILKENQKYKNFGRAYNINYDLISEDKDILISNNYDEVKTYEREVLKNEVESDIKRIEVLLGHDEFSDTKTYWYPNDTSKSVNMNTGIIGVSGTGKTQCTMSVIAQIHEQMKNEEDFGILIFDYNKDYSDKDSEFVKRLKPKILQPHKLPFNPFSLNTEEEKPLLPLHTANVIRDTMQRAYNLREVQRSILRDCIIKSYERRGIEKGDSNTWDKIPPTFNDLFVAYTDREDVKEDSLYSIISELNDFKVFEEDPLETTNIYDLIKGVVVIDVSGFSRSIQNLVIAITLDQLYSQIVSRKHSRKEIDLIEVRKLILVDEAENFLSQNFDSMKKILKEGRKYGVGTILSTQNLSDFVTSENDYQQYVLNWVVHKISNVKSKDIRRLFEASKSEELEILNKIKKLEKHYSILNLGNNEPKCIRDKPFYELYQEI